VRRPAARSGLWLILFAFVAGCGGPSAEVFSVSIVNDTHEAVVVRDCDDYCSSSPIALTVQPGDSTPINRIARDHKSFSITTASGGHVGCLDLFFAAPQPGARVPVSEAIACAGHPRPFWQTAGLVVLVILVLALPFLAVRTGRRKAVARRSQVGDIQP
jgi:hypothetical protein